jgi:ABC-type transport system involved in multi-copper enzyme maturation permease subunit
MLSRVAAIAFNTYREALRARILLGLATVAFAVAFYSIIVGAYTLRNAARVVSDLGSASASAFAIAVAIIIGATSLHRELEQKTLFPILARPLRRGEYVVGKFAGTVLTITVFLMADAGLVLLISAAIGGGSLVRIVGVGAGLSLGLAVWMWRSTWARTFGPIPWSLIVLCAGIALSGVAPDERRVVLASGALAVLEVCIVVAIGLVFSSFSTPFLSALFTLGLVLIGRNADSLARLPAKELGLLGEALATAGRFIARIVPNLYVYVPPRPLLTGEIVGQPLDSYLGMATAAAVAWSVGLLAVAAFIFRKRDFL